MSSDYRERADDDARDAERAEADAMQAEMEWRDRHLAMVEDALNAIGPADVLHHVAGYISRPKPWRVAPLEIDEEAW
jgi:NAD(P)-dependent dehydrogenase (short-subunit alcohol dehydrogenase family)